MPYYNANIVNNYNANIVNIYTQRILTPGDLNWVQH